MKREIQNVLIHMHEDPQQAALLHAGGIERLVAIEDEDYNDIRAMFARVQAAEQPAISLRR
ncbi:hypothetical protein [Dictyobacter kobayashii]|uniref:Uncharacterized protein n=1 Tax=Dictyobacter kobayashii TaxID=2014872 RepID=A0A402AGB7_9CHLR|nr:hypothetical protein [Dictyobacter kobayashii]GCE18170.1 hypothetical protein KDK_19700 [Dictyobacter kobayashii]